MLWNLVKGYFFTRKFLILINELSIALSGINYHEVIDELFIYVTQTGTGAS